MIRSEFWGKQLIAFEIYEKRDYLSFGFLGKEMVV